MKLSPTTGVITFSNTSITTPLLALTVNGNVTPKKQIGVFEYDLTIANSDELSSAAPALLPKGFSFEGLEMKGTYGLEKGDPREASSVFGYLMLKKLSSPSGDIQDISLDYELDNAELEITLRKASLFGGNLRVRAHTNILQRQPRWRASATFEGLSLAKMAYVANSDITALSGNLTMRVTNIKTIGWQYNDIMQNIQMDSSLTIENATLKSKLFGFVKMGIAGYASTWAKTESDKELLTLITSAPADYRFSITDGLITYKRGKYTLTNMQLKSEDSFSFTCDGSLQYPRSIAMTLSLGGFETISQHSAFKGDTFPIQIKGKLLPLPPIDFSSFFTANK